MRRLEGIAKGFQRLMRTVFFVISTGIFTNQLWSRLPGMLTKKREAEYRKKTEELIKKIDFEKDYHNITTTSLYRKKQTKAEAK